MTMTNPLLAITLFAAAGLVAAATQTDKVHVRLEINDLMTMPAHAEAKDLFVLGLRAVMARPPTDPFSWWQIARIHGYPATVWNGVYNAAEPWTFNATDPLQAWGGYCEHSSTIFLTWHRPYVLMVEQEVCGEAKKIARRYPAAVRSKYVKAAKRLRFPFWDWAATAINTSGVPSFLVQDTVHIRHPVRGHIDVGNPLYNFKINRAVTNPAANTTYPSVLSVGQNTTRWPDSTTVPFPTSNNTAFDLGVRNAWSTNQQQVLDLFSSPDYFCFSMDESFVSRPDCAFVSLEGVHDAVHNAIGGNGTMASLEAASFDPIFFLHHCNTDRLLALFQGVHPDEYMIDGTLTKGSFVEPVGTKVTVNSSLYPFRTEPKRRSSAFYTSANVRDTRALGYTYPELVDSPNRTELWVKLYKQYNGKPLGFRWFYVFWCTGETGAYFKVLTNLSTNSAAPKPPSLLNGPRPQPSLLQAIAKIKAVTMQQLPHRVASSVDITQAMQDELYNTSVPCRSGGCQLGPAYFPVSVADVSLIVTSNSTSVSVKCYNQVAWVYADDLASDPDNYFKGINASLTAVAEDHIVYN